MKYPKKYPHSHEQGVSLIVVLLILVIVSILGVSGIQLSMLAEKSARNDRDYQIAWQSSEAALIDAEMDIEGLPASFGNRRNTIFKNPNINQANFPLDCGSSGKSKGLCFDKGMGKPSWLTVDFTAAGNQAVTTEFGTFTGRSFASGGPGIQPAQAPRYLIEAIPDPATSRTTSPGSSDYRFIYRVTAMGFGPNPETQAVVQMLYRN